MKSKPQENIFMSFVFFFFWVYILPADVTVGSKPWRDCSVRNLAAGEGSGTPLQYSSLENPMGRGALWAAVHGVARSQTWLSNFIFTFQFDALEKEMATRSSILAWRILGTGAWWAAVYGVALSRTRLTRLSSSSSILHYSCYTSQIQCFLKSWTGMR